MPQSLIERFGRRLRIAMIGGGIGSFIGETHRIALRADGMWELVAGVFSRHQDVNEATGRMLLLNQDRVYKDYLELIAKETNRPDPVDAVILATPPSDHLGIASALLSHGFHVVCEKPISVSSDEAKRIDDAAQSANRRFLLTNCYSAYPMVRLARDMIRNGDLGRISMVHVEFASGAFVHEPEDRADRPWRLSPDEMGGLGALADLGTHVFQMGEFVSGQSITKVAAHLSKMAPGREVYDNAFVDANFDRGAVGRFWVSYQAIGNVHGLRFNVFGDRGSLQWDHESAELMWLRRKDQPAQQLTKAGPLSTSMAMEASRFSAGHPDGYGLAFATLYRDLAKILMLECLGEDSAAIWKDLPGAKAGLNSMRIIEAVLQSAPTHEWISV